MTRLHKTLYHAMTNAWKITGAMSKTCVRVVIFFEIHFVVASLIVLFITKRNLFSERALYIAWLTPFHILWMQSILLSWLRFKKFYSNPITYSLNRISIRAFVCNQNRVWNFVFSPNISRDFKGSVLAPIITNVLIYVSIYYIIKLFNQQYQLWI